MLALVGHAGRDSERLRALAGELGIAERVRITGWLSDEDLEGLYRLATGFVYPSLHEGFGMPVLEAMRRGTAGGVRGRDLAAGGGGGRGAAVRPRAGSRRSTGAARAAARAGGAASSSQRGRERAAGFGWERTARAAIASYERALTDAASPGARPR